MARTTEEEVRAIIEVDASITSLTPFITAANAAVNAHCVGLSVDNALLVETWLAAHFITIRDNRVSSEAAGEVSQSFQYRLESGLGCSMYGQTAMALDTTGGLSRWNSALVKGTAGRTASAVWLGKPLE